ncbi:MAG: Ni/Fe-hydrogenase cytochrome b subunit [Proteobacteria bacterium]|nr:Ni/Fe-hydrogenase cytochrome b subunit [Pseudomonadota bacterium]
MRGRLSRLAAGLTFWRLVLAGLLALGAYATVVRFGRGLGAATNLSDAFPWGLWIGFDVLVGVGLAAGGFAVAATVHVFHITHYKPIARPAVFTAFVGYVLVIVGLLFDLGQPWDIWHPLVMWNPRSVMFEVAWCVMLYTTVLALEFSPLVLERLGLQAPLRLVRAIYVPLVVIGVLLSMLHQSSLGTLYVIVPDKLYGLWYTPWLPVFFFLTAIAAGLAMTIVESYLSQRAFGRELEHDLLDGLARVTVVVLGVYLMWKAQDLTHRGQLALALQLTPEAVMFWGEIGLGVLLPIALLTWPRVRSNRTALFFAALLVVLGFVANRLNVAVTGMARSSGTHYVPSVLELGVTFSLVAAGFAAFAWAARYLDLFPAARPELAPSPKSTAAARAAAAKAAVQPSPTASGWGIAGLWVLLLAGWALLTVARNREATTRTPAAALASQTARRSLAGVRPAAWPAQPRLPAAFSFPRAAGSPGAVSFDHASHIDAAKPRCAHCHREQFSLLRKGSPLRGRLVMDRIRHGELCGRCHNGKQAFGVVPGECDVCHGQ